MSDSVQELVLRNYAASAEATGDSQLVMDNSEVLTCLRAIEDYQLSPVDAIRTQTSVGDPRMPTPPLMAILQWLQDAFALWEEGFPIEEPVGSQLRQLVPAVAAVAISDDKFFVPGAHCVHQLLDALHSSAIGWQPQLGRAGVALEQLISTAIEDLNTWLKQDGVDLEILCDDLISKVNKDHDRAQRMTQRIVETEKGKFKTASARWKSAQMINLALENHKATAEIGAFLRGPWYESAQLVLLKFGADSSEWAQMSDTTLALLDSLKTDDSDDEERRQYLFEAVTKLPKDIKRWLLSLHMDPDGVSEAVGLIELTHLHLLREQAVALEEIEPLPMDGMTPERVVDKELEDIDALEAGQWFLVDSGSGDYLRVQLVLKLEQEQLLQFTNRAGIKAMQPGYAEFRTMLSSGEATLLQNGASFSLCLANAAGVWTEEEAERLQDEQLEPDSETSEDVSPVFEAEEDSSLVEEIELTLDQDSTEQDEDEDEEDFTSDIEPSEPAEPETEIIIPMGTWLGFHDGDTPLMAKLAVHDLEQDSYIFVNREGIKMRSLNMRELTDLMDKDQVDILEARSNFRAEVTRVKKQED